MTIAITVNKRKTKDRPVESAFAQRFLCSDLAGWIVLLWFQLIVLAPRMRARFVDRAGAGKDKPRARCMRFHGGYQVEFCSRWFLIGRGKVESASLLIATSYWIAGTKLTLKLAIRFCTMVMKPQMRQKRCKRYRVSTYDL